MRLLGIVGLVLLPKLALAHPSGHGSHDTPVVHDHRGSSGEEHHSSAPVVRDHRDYDRGDVYIAPNEEVIVDDGVPAAVTPVYHPSLTLEFGGMAHSFTGPAFARSGSVQTTSGDMASYSLASGTPAAGDTSAGAFDMRLTTPIGPHLYAGAELELGGVTRSPIALMSDSDLHIASQSMVGGDAVVGARVRSGIAELDGELAGGVRVLATTVQSIDATDQDPSQTDSAATALVEARVRGALWLSPHAFVAATAGIGVFDPSDKSVGLSIGLASHMFGS